MKSLNRLITIGWRIDFADRCEIKQEGSANGTNRTQYMTLCFIVFLSQRNAIINTLNTKLFYHRVDSTRKTEIELQMHTHRTEALFFFLPTAVPLSRTI